MIHSNIRTLVRKLLLLMLMLLSLLNVSGIAETECWDNTDFFITDSFLSRDKEVILCTIKTKRELPIAEEMRNIQHNQSIIANKLDLYPQIECFDLEGNRLWSFTLYEDSPDLHEFCIYGQFPDGRILVCDSIIEPPIIRQPSEFFTIDSNGDKQKLSQELDSLLKESAIWVLDEGILAQSKTTPGSFSFWEYGSAEVSPRWNTSIFELENSWGNEVIISDDGYVFFGLSLSEEEEYPGVIFLLDKDGQFRWKYTTDDRFGIISAATIKDDRVIVNSHGESQDMGALLSIDLNNGQLLEKRELKEWILQAHQDSTEENTVFQVREDNTHHLVLWANGRQITEIEFYPEILVLPRYETPRVLSISPDTFLVLYTESQEISQTNRCVAHYIHVL